MIVSAEHIFGASKGLTDREEAVVEHGISHGFLYAAEGMIAVRRTQCLGFFVVYALPCVLVFGYGNVHDDGALNGVTDFGGNALDCPLIPCNLVVIQMIVAARLHFLLVVGIHHEQRVDRFAVFGDVDDIVAVAHAARTVIKEAVFCFCKLICTPEFADESCMICISHDSCPRDTVAVDKADQSQIGKGIKGIVARQRDQIGFGFADELIHGFLGKFPDFGECFAVVALNVGKVQNDKIAVGILFNLNGIEIGFVRNRCIPVVKKRIPKAYFVGAGGMLCQRFQKFVDDADISGHGFVSSIVVRMWFRMISKLLLSMSWWMTPCSSNAVASTVSAPQ